MVYESGYTTLRSYSSWPAVRSYPVSVYKTSYPIYSSYSRVISSPVRVISSPTRVITRVIHSPVRVIHSPVRVIHSPVRVIRTIRPRISITPERTVSYSNTSTTTTTKSEVSSYSRPTSYYSSYQMSSYPYVHSYPSYLYPSYYPRTLHTYSRARSVSPVTTSSSSTYYNKYIPGYGDRALTNYLTSEPFATFREETNRIRSRAQTLMRDLHTPIIRRSRSCTPFPIHGYEPQSEKALDAYVARITNPVRNIAKEVHRMSWYPEPTSKLLDPELDPNRPSRKFSGPRNFDDLVKDNVKESGLKKVNEEDVVITEA